MTLDQRARRAADRFRHRVEAMQTSASQPGTIQRFEHYRARKQRNQRIGAVLVAGAVAVAAALLIGKAFPRADKNLPAQPSKNGRIVYGRAVPGVDGIRLFSVDADGNGEVALPVTFTDCAAWSPDGTKMQVTGSEYPGAPLRPVVVNADGSGYRVLPVVAPPKLNLGCGDWSPDGTRLALEGFTEPGPTQLSGIYTVRASDAGDLTHVATAPGGNPAYSPDGTRISFIAGDPTRHLKPNAGALFVVNTNGTGLRRITPWGVAQRSGGRWSPDGEWILFQRTGGGLMLMHPDGSDIQEIAVAGLPPGAHAIAPNWSPDGTLIVFGLIANRQEDLYIVRSDGTGLVQLTDTPDVDERRPDWGLNVG
ncbi:MAG: hypothetical protein M3P43_02755 [Actinomycetota bacterium]|nr:hypothetical protein [Actinomycetota bacterium]